MKYHQLRLDFDGDSITFRKQVKLKTGHRTVQTVTATRLERAALVEALEAEKPEVGAPLVGQEK